MSSPHTGRTLPVLEGEVVCRDDAQSQRFHGLLKKFTGRPVPARDESEGADGAWLVDLISSTQTTWSGAHGSTTFALRLTTYESRRATRLVVGDLTLDPYAYLETVSDGRGLIVQAKVRADADVAARVRALADGDAVDVRRVGVSDVPRRMRLDDLWLSRHGDETRFALTFSDAATEAPPEATEASDGEAASRNYRPGLELLWLTDASLASVLGRIRALEQVLVERGVLTDADLALVRERGVAARVAAALDLHTLGDVDRL